MEKQLQAISTAMGLQFPESYINFMVQHQVVDSKLLNDLTLVYGTTDIASRNLDYEISAYLPGYLLIGNDGGDNGIVIKANGSSDSNIYLCPLGSLAEEDLAIIAYDINEWASRNYDAVNVLQESSSIREFHESDIFKLRLKYAELKSALKDIEDRKSRGILSLKDYLLEKKVAQQALNNFEVLHEGKQYRL